MFALEHLNPLGGLEMVKLRRVESQHRVNEMTSWSAGESKYTQEFSKVVALFPYLAIVLLGLHSTPLINSFYRKVKNTSPKGYFILEGTIPEFQSESSDVSEDSDGLTLVLDDLCYKATHIMKRLTTTLFNNKGESLLEYDYAFTIYFIPQVNDKKDITDNKNNKSMIYKFGYDSVNKSVYAESPYNKALLTKLDSKNYFKDFFNAAERGNLFTVANQAKQNSLNPKLPFEES